MTIPAIIRIDAAATFRITAAGSVLTIAALACTVWSADVMNRLELPVERSTTEALALLENHPADRRAWSRIAANSLDLPSEHRLELWRLARGTLDILAPSWPAFQIETLRAAFIHWDFLDTEDRDRAIETAGKLLEKPSDFSQYWQWIWRATGNFEIIEARAPDEPRIQSYLISIAATNGLFDDYRRLRDRLPAVIDRDLASRPRSTDGLIRELASLERGPASLPLMQPYLTRLEKSAPQRTNLDAGVIRGFIDFAARSGIQNLRGFHNLANDRKTLNPSLLARYGLAVDDIELADHAEHSTADTTDREWIEYHVARALIDIESGATDEAVAHLDTVPATDRSLARHRFASRQLALALGDTKRAMVLEQSLDESNGVGRLTAWQGLCGNEICSSRAAAEYFVSDAATVVLSVKSISTDQVKPWIEIYREGALVDEGAVEESHDFRIHLPSAGLHILEVRLANPRTRDGRKRVIAIASATIP